MTKLTFLENDDYRLVVVAHFGGQRSLGVVQHE